MVSCSLRRASRRAQAVLSRRRAASIAEYMLILVAVLLVGAGVWKVLGSNLVSRSVIAGEAIGGGAGDVSGAGGGGVSGRRSGGGSVTEVAGGATVGDSRSVGESKGVGESKSVADSSETAGDGTVSSKYSMGGAKGEGGRVAGGAVIPTDTPPADDIVAGASMKRWLGLALLAAGLLAGGYVFFSLRRAKRTAEAIEAKSSTAGLPPAAPPMV